MLPMYSVPLMCRSTFLETEADQPAAVFIGLKPPAILLADMTICALMMPVS
jgi:hypothetical protein